MGDRLLDAAAIADRFGGAITQMTLPLPPKRPMLSPGVTEFAPIRRPGRVLVHPLRTAEDPRALP